MAVAADPLDQVAQALRRRRAPRQRPVSGSGELGHGERREDLRQQRAVGHPGGSASASTTACSRRHPNGKALNRRLVCVRPSATGVPAPRADGRASPITTGRPRAQDDRDRRDRLVEEPVERQRGIRRDVVRRLRIQAARDGDRRRLAHGIDDDVQATSYALKSGPLRPIGEDTRWRRSRLA